MNLRLASLDERYSKYRADRQEIFFHSFGESEFLKSDNFAIVVPFRERSDHLKRFLDNRSIKNFNSKIYLFEQTKGKKFNKGILFNAAFRELAPYYDRFIFHDIDLLPNEKMFQNYYFAGSGVVHYINPDSELRYNFLNLFGGVTSFSRQDFKAINGFPNEFYGWGAEDEVLYNRVARANLKVFRPSCGEYFVIDHEKSRREQRNPFMREMEIDYFYNSIEEGLSEVEYNVLGIEENQRYIRYNIDF